MSPQLKGVACGIGSAVFYGTNPLGAIFLNQEGVGASSALVYRFSFACVILALMMLVRKQSFRLNKAELALLLPLGFIFALSSLTFYHSFDYIDSGMACSLLFVYPVMVALLMAIFFKEKLKISTAIAMVLALTGIGMLYGGGETGVMNPIGVGLIMVSALSYAIYIVVVNRGLQMSSIKLTFYVMFFCGLFILLYVLLYGTGLQPLTTPASFGYALFLGIVPTVLSLVLMAQAVHLIGSTPTAVMGALEPVTAVTFGVLVLNEVITFQIVCGILLILVSVTIIVLGKNFTMSRLISVAGRARQVLKHWRWHPS